MEAVATPIGVSIPKIRGYERWRWQVFAATWLAYAGFYLTRKALSVAKIGIAADAAMGMSNAALGVADGAFLTAYMLGMFVWGPTSDRFGTRTVVIGGIVGSVLASIVMGFTTSAPAFIALCALHGVAQATGWAPLNKTMAAWFSRKERGWIMGWWCTNYAIGGLVATPFAGLMAQSFGSWRYAFFIPALSLAAVGAVFYLLQRNRPEDVGLPPIEAYHHESVDALPGQEEAAGSRWHVIREVLANPAVWILGSVYFLLKPARYAILFWAPKYLHETLATDIASSGIISAMFELGGPLGILGMGYLSDRWLGSRRFPIMVVCLLLLTPLLFFFNWIAQGGIVWAGIGLFALGLLIYGPDSLMSSTAAVDFGTKRGAGTATGFINGLGSIGAILGGSVPGFVAARWGWDGIFYGLGGATLLAALVLLPSWNRLPTRACGSATR